MDQQFAEGLSSWRRILEQAGDDDRLEIFSSAARETAHYIAKGLDENEAADELTDIAQSVGLDNDLDRVQAIIARTIDEADELRVAITDQVKPNGGQDNVVPLRRPNATRYLAPDPSSIPRRAWLYGGHYIRQAASATVAPGGYGKTTLQLYEAIEMVAAGRRVWYLSGEDPLVELDRRIAAHCLQHNIKLATQSGQLFVDDRTTFPLFIAGCPRPGLVFDDESLARFEAAIGADQIDVVILDPFISFHTVPENDNGGVDAVIKRLAAIAVRADCSIEISHHVRKPFTGQREITVDDARGGSAIINAVRSGRVINRMSAGEAEQAKIDPDQKNFYVRLDLGKRNMAPPDKATWFKLVSVFLHNDPDGGLGDNVQALAPWQFPGLMDELSVEDTEYIRELVRRQPYRADPRSDQWLGIEIAKRLKLNINVVGDIKKIQKFIGVWLRNSVFKKLELRDADSRKMRMFYTAVDAKRDAENDSNVVQLFAAAAAEAEDENA